jgi:hypothetical protein
VSDLIKKKHFEIIENLLLESGKSMEKYEEISYEIQKVMRKTCNSEFIHHCVNRLCVIAIYTEENTLEEFQTEIYKVIAWIRLYKIALFDSDAKDTLREIVGFAEKHGIKLDLCAGSFMIYPAILYFCLDTPGTIKSISYDGRELTIANVNHIPAITPGLSQKLLDNKYNFRINKNNIIVSLKKTKLSLG